MGLTISLGLRRVKELKNKLSELDARLRASTVWTEGSPPVWKYEDLVAKRKILVAELVTLKARIAKANATTTVMIDGEDWTLSEAVALLAELKGEIALYSSLHVQDQEKRTETSKSWEPDEHDYSKRVKVENTTVTLCALTTAKRAEKIEALKERFQHLNDEVETANHQTQLPVV